METPPPPGSAPLLSSSGQKRKALDEGEGAGEDGGVDPGWLSLATPALATPAPPRADAPRVDGAGLGDEEDGFAPVLFPPCFVTPEVCADRRAFARLLPPRKLAPSSPPPFPGGGGEDSVFPSGGVFVDGDCSADVSGSVLIGGDGDGRGTVSGSVPIGEDGDGSGAVSVPIGGDGKDALSVSVLVSGGDRHGAASFPVVGDGSAAVEVLVRVPSNPNNLSATPLPPASDGAPPSPSPSDSQPQRPARPPDRRSHAAAGDNSNNNVAARQRAARGRDPDPPALLERPPFPWATNRMAYHHSIAELRSRGITTVEGEVECRRCERHATITYDVVAKFSDLAGYLTCDRVKLHDRAPAKWTTPVLPDCDDCHHKNCLKPVIPPEKEKINWVFLLLSETLGLCTLDQLKHFCKHTNKHRTGAKDRVLFSTYLELCNQLCPNGLFDMTSERESKSVRLNAS